MPNQIQSILESNRVGTLATINPDGSPWATTVHIFTDDNALYWFSKDTHQHSTNIEVDPRVSVALWARTESTVGAYISGAAVKLSAEETANARQLVVEAIGTIPSYFEGTFAYKLNVGQPDLSKSSDKRWYFYS